jgi:eukaryotic-like serine/threonine-protein kinase
MHDHFDLSPAQWGTLRRLLDEALSRQGEDRARWLEGLAGEDAAFRPRLNALLAHADGATGDAVLDTLPKIETGQFAPLPGAAAAGMPERIGPYRLIRELGSGGMASVWLAERTDMLHGRQVALKLPHGAWKRAGLAERMQREREILATLEHPNIARLYDAGVGEDGQPWLALEFVAGERLDTYCESHALDTAARLRLFLQVARAVAHAHAQLVVHRDLKPSNILVTGAGEVKLLDFGIAKLLDQGVARETDLTQQAGRALTPDYAAPEQILGLPVGTAADVYGLGVVLYELLAGQRPYRLRRDSRGALEDAILQADIAAPSARAPAGRRKALRGDLDTIVLKALRREPAERYATVAALAEDIERFLQHRPVLALPDRAWYRVGKFVRRNRAAVGSAVLVMLALVAGTGVALWQAAQARAEARRAEAAKTFVTGLFTDADPFATRSGGPSAQALLEQARQRLDEAAIADPALRVELLEVLGRSLIGLGSLDPAESALQQGLGLARQQLGEKHLLTLRTRVALTSIDRFRGRQAQMQAELSELLPKLRALGAAAKPELFAAVTNQAHAAIDGGRYAEARIAAVEALALGEAVFGERHPETANAALLLAGAENYAGTADVALAAAQRARERLLQAHGAQRPHARVLDGRFVYGRALGNAGRHDEAVRELEEVLQGVQSLLGTDAPMAGFVAADIARFQLELGDAAASLVNAQRALQIVSRVAQESSTTVGMAHAHIGRAQLALWRLDEAQAALQRARDTLQALRGERHPLVVDLSAQHALAVALAGRVTEAWRTIELLLPGIRAEPQFRWRGLHIAGIVRRLGGALDEAAVLQKEAFADLPESAPQLPRRAAVQAELARVTLEQGRPVEALALLRRLPALEAASPERAGRWLTEGRALLALGLADEARGVLAQAHAYWQQHDARSPWTADAARWLQRATRART